MSSEISILVLAAATIGFVHTITGPDHYLPFVVLSRARNWSEPRTLLVTAVCGLGHVLGSVVLGALGIGLGWAVGSLEFVEGVRGDLAAWLLISFGLVYTVWGWRRSVRGHTHAHPHAPPGGTSVTPWALFIIFVLGPCEPLIPLLMYPAARTSLGGLALVAGVFSVVTIGTMMITVLLLARGVRLLPMARLERHAHTLAGLAILGSGLAIQFLGL